MNPPVRIRVFAGTSKRHQKLMLLHELTHWLLPRGEHHSDNFYNKAFEMYRKYKISVRYAYECEKDYKKRSIVAYKRNVARHQADLAIKHGEEISKKLLVK